MLHSPALALVLFVVDSTLIVWVWQSIFPSWGDLWHAIGYWLKPDWLSMIQGDYAEDFWETTKLFVAVALTAVLIAGPIYVWKG